MKIIIIRMVRVVLVLRILFNYLQIGFYDQSMNIWLRHRNIASSFLMASFGFESQSSAFLLKDYLPNVKTVIPDSVLFGVFVC